MKKILLVLVVLVVLLTPMGASKDEEKIAFETKNDKMCGVTIGDKVVSYSTRAYCTCPAREERIIVGNESNNWYCEPGELCAVPYSCQHSGRQEG